MGQRFAAGQNGVTRRALLGATATGAAGLAGCLERKRTTMATDEPERVSLSIKTMPADEDNVAANIARTLEKHLEMIGVGVDLVNIRENELRQEVLLDHDFDIFVGRFPDFDDPDFLRPVLHSSFSNELGWQNPFDFTYLEADDLLAEQRKTQGDERYEAVSNLQHLIAREQPFTVVAIPDEIRCVRTEGFRNWERFPIHNPLSFAAIEMSEDADQLRVGSTEGSITESLNPISARYHDRMTVIGLLYDSLGRSYDGSIQPWLAEDWDITEESGRTNIRLDLWPDIRWHDGSQITAEDVVFTFQFLSDTTLGNRETPVPAPRFRDRSSLVETATAVDDRTARLVLLETSQNVAERVLTAPLLPESEWGDLTGPGDLAGVSASTYLTQALVWDNDSPVGSGVFQFESKSASDNLRFRRFDDHILHRDDSPLREQFGSGVPVSELDIEIVPSDDSMVELLNAGDLDASISDLNPGVVPAIQDSDALDLRIESTQSFYVIGYNTRRAPLGNPRFRQIVAQLLDKEFLAEELLDGYGAPAASPLAGTEWLPEALEWGNQDPELPFLGSGGELNEELAREQFRTAGFRYGEEGELLQR